MSEIKQNGELNNSAQILLKAIERREAWEKARVSSPHVQVAAIVGIFPYLYERIRTFVEFPDENLIRHRALERIIKRRLTFGFERGEEFARALLGELITARYIKNDWLPESLVANIGGVIQKYQFLMQEMRKGAKMPPSPDLCVSLAAREIELLVSPRFEDEALVEFAKAVLEPRALKAFNLSPEIIRVLLEIAVRRVIAHNDDISITLALLKKMIPDFSQKPEPKIVQDTLKAIYRALYHPSLLPFTASLRTVRPIFALVKELMAGGKENFAKVIDDKKRFGELLQEMIFEKFGRARRARFWSVVRALLYIFITKILLLLFLEFPYEQYVLHGIRPLPLAINLLAPPIFILIFTSGARRPYPSSIASAIKEVSSVLFEGSFSESHPIFRRPPSIKRHPVLRVFFWVLYALFSLLMLGLVALALRKLQFSALGLVVFYSFMSLVGFFGFRIRASFSETVPISVREPLLVTFFDLLLLPFVHIGRYLARTFAKINVIVFFLDMLIEVPFKAFFGIMEDWLTFVKEKKEEITRDN